LFLVIFVIFSYSSIMVLNCGGGYTTCLFILRENTVKIVVAMLLQDLKIGYIVPAFPIANCNL